MHAAHVSQPPVSLPTPTQLYRQYELGQIDRERLHAAMTLHAKLILAEVEEVRVNPLIAYLDQQLCKRHAAKLIKAHSEDTVREVLTALSEIPDFPPALLLWNADHSLVPLHCFFRIKRGPVFQVLQMKVDAQQVDLQIEHGAKDHLLREQILLRRNRQGKLHYVHKR
jgi:hypothetical protein